MFRLIWGICKIAVAIILALVLIILLLAATGYLGYFLALPKNETIDGIEYSYIRATHYAAVEDCDDDVTDAVISPVAHKYRVTKITGGAFSGDLKTVVIPKSVILIDAGAFTSCQNLTDVYYTGSESDWANVSAQNAFPEGVIFHFNYNP